MKKPTGIKTSRLTWDKADTFQGSTEWTLRRGGEAIAEIQRERPTRWHANGVGGQVRDNNAPWLWLAWMFTPDGGRQQIRVRDGSSVSAVKATVEEYVIRATFTSTATL